VAGEEDDEEVIEALRQEVKEMEKSGTRTSDVRASSLLLRVRAFVTKVKQFDSPPTIHTHYPSIRFAGVHRLNVI
jgi:hypothetical protein